MPEDEEPEYVAVINQEDVTDEVRDIAINYDPLNRSGDQGFHVTDEGDLHIDPGKVMEAHKLIQKKIPNDAIRILPLASETGTLVHQYGENAFRLYELPVPKQDKAVGIIGRNGIGKSTAVQILAGVIEPNLGHYEEGPADPEELVEHFKGTEAQAFLQRLNQNQVDVEYKPQRVELIPKQYDVTCGELLEKANERDNLDEVTDALDISHIMDNGVDEVSGGELQRLAIAATLVKDADVYVFDEPASYMDLHQRLHVSQYLNDQASDERSIVVIEHDLIILDYLADLTHLMYGEPGAYGVVSNLKSTKAGINTYLQGYLQDENVIFRDHEITFNTRSHTDTGTAAELTHWDEFRTTKGDFTLQAEDGSLHEQEIIGVLGENGIGKTTFVETLAEELHIDVAHKPQYLQPDNATVEDYLHRAVRRYEHELINTLELDNVLENELDDLSGGELQRVMIAKTLAADADIYLFDEPSAYLDVEQRIRTSEVITDFIQHNEEAAIVVDHDLLFLDYLSDRLLVFHGTTGEHGRATGPHTMQDGMNKFLRNLGMTFRRDPQNNRPRANKPGSVKDREQKEAEQYYYT